MAVKALLFDVFGTLVDWRSGVARDAEASSPTTVRRSSTGARSPTPGGLATTRRWPTVRNCSRTWTNLDVLHRESLDGVLEQFALDVLTPRRPRRLTLAWHRLDPWPDVVEGLHGCASASCSRRARTGTSRCRSGSHATVASLGREPRRRAGARLQARRRRLPAQRRGARPEAAEAMLVAATRPTSCRGGVRPAHGLCSPAAGARAGRAAPTGGRARRGHRRRRPRRARELLDAAPARSAGERRAAGPPGPRGGGPRPPPGEPAPSPTAG